MKRYDAWHNSVTFPKFDDQTPIGSTDKAKKIGLVVLFHGLNGQPSLWNGHVCELLKHSGVDLFVPEVPEAGHTRLADTASKVLLRRIVDWTKRNPGLPVALCGQSNGSRYPILFEPKLRKKAPTTPVHVSLTAGVVYGTSTVDLANTLVQTDLYPHRSFGKLSRANCKELAFGNDIARKQIRDVRKPLAPGVACRDYVMYSPIHDVLVPDTGSGLPILVLKGQKSKQEKHYIVTNYGHNAMVTALAERQIEYIVTWMKNQ